MKKCKCYEESYEIVGWLGPDEVIRKLRKRCNGTRERDICSCGGDETKCDFYPEVRKKAKKKTKISTNADKIRKMTDEELANLLIDFDLFKLGVCRTETCPDDKSCIPCTLKWLKRPAIVLKEKKDG